MVEAIDTTLLYTEGCDRVRVIQGDTTHDLLPVYEVDAVPVSSAHMTDNPMFDRDLDVF